MLHLVALLALAVVLLAVAGDLLVSGAGRLATRLGLRPIVVGAVITGIAASVSTLIVVALASLRGHEELAAAGLAGANIVNLTVVLGVGGLVAELRISSALLPRQALLSTAAVTIFALMLLGRLTWGASAPLVAALIGAVALLVVMARSSPQDVMAAQSTRYLTTAGPARLVVELARTLAGLAGVLAGALLLVNNASELAARTGASPERVGLTLVACAAALPMLILAIRTQRRSDSDLLVGAVLVGTLVNSLAGGALVALTAAGAPAITPTVNVAMVGISGFICALLPIGTPLARGWSVVLLVVYALVLLI